MKRPNELALWKRVLGVIGCVVASLWMVASALHSMSLACTPHAGCEFRERRAFVTTDEADFGLPSADRVKATRHGKANGRGDVVIETDTGKKVVVTWLSADEAAAGARELVEATAAGRPFELASHGPRWWLLFLLLTIPLALSFVIPQRLPIPMPTPVQQIAATTPVRNKKLERAERKAREHRERIT